MTTTMTATQASATITGYNVLFWDSGNGSHNNTIRTMYGAEYYLKCAHEGDVLTGVYLSPLYDLGSSQRYMVYVLCAIVVTGAGTTWDDLVPVPMTWNQMGEITWDSLVTLSAGPSISIRLKYGETYPMTSTVDKLEILTAIVTGRYFRVEITITDPSAEINAMVENFTLKFAQPS